MPEIGAVKGRLALDDTFTPALARAGAQLDAFGQKYNRVGASLTQAGTNLTRAVTLPLAALGAGAVKFASDFESSFAGVRKTVDATEAQFATLAQGFRDMAKEVPTSVDGLNAIGESAGQLGIKTESILGFTRVVADLGVTTNLSADQAATSLARLANITGLPQDQFDRLGSTIVDLGNNFATTEAEIVEFGLRMAGAGEIAGLTEAEILGIGAALSSVGVNAEAGGTAVQKVLLGMTQAVAEGGAELQTFATTAGMSASEFAAAFRDDAGAAFTAFVEGLGEQGDRAFNTLEDLNLQDQRLIRSFLSLAGAGDLLSEALATGNRAFEENTALAKEAEQRYETFESQLRLFWNQLKDVGITLGQELIPVLRQLLTDLQPVIDRLGEWARAFGELEPRQQKIILGIGAFAAALGPALVGLGLMTSALASLGTAAGAVTGVLGGPIGLVALLAGITLASPGVRQSLADMTRGLTDYLVKADEWLENTRLNREAADLWAGALRQLDFVLGENQGTMERWAASAQKINRIIGAIITGGLTELGPALERHGRALREQVPVVAEVRGTFAEAAAAGEDFAAALDKVVVPAEKLSPPLAEVAVRAREAVEIFATLPDAIPVEEMEIGTRRFHDMIVMLKRLGKEAGDQIDREIDDRLKKSADALKRIAEDQVKAAEATRQAWVNAAQIMADAFGQAFGSVGDGIEQILNGVVQLIALFQQFSQIAQGFSAGGGGLLGRLGGFLTGGVSGAGPAGIPLAPGFTGAGTTLGGGLLGLGIGAGIGGVGSQLGLGGYAQEGGAAGGAIGGAIAAAFTGGLGGPAGAAIGGAIGTVVGALIKKGVDVASVIITDEGFRTVRNESNQLLSVVQDWARDLIASVDQFAETIGAEVLKAGIPELQLDENGIFTVFGHPGGAFSTEDFGQAFEASVFAAIKGTTWAGLSENIEQAIIRAGSFDELQQHVELALAIDNLGIPELQRGAQEANDALLALAAAGTQLGMDITNVQEAIATNTEEWRNRILGIEMTAQERALAQMEAFNAEWHRLVEQGFDPAFLGDLLTREEVLGQFADAVDEGPSKKKQRREQRKQERLAFEQELAAIIDGARPQLLAAFEDIRAKIAEIEEGAKKFASTADLAAEAVAALEAELIRLGDEAVLSFGDSLLNTLDRYFGEVEGFETFRRNMEKLRFDLEVANLRAQFLILNNLGLLSTSVANQILGIFAFIDANNPFASPAVPTGPGGIRGRPNRRNDPNGPPPFVPPAPVPPPPLTFDPGTFTNPLEDAAAAVDAFVNSIRSLVGGLSPLTQVTQRFDDLRESFSSLSRFQQQQVFRDLGDMIRALGITGEGPRAVKELLDKLQGAELERLLVSTFDPLLGFVQRAKGGGSSTQTLSQRRSAAAQAFSSAFDAVLGGNLDRVGDLASLADRLISTTGSFAGGGAASLVERQILAGFDLIFQRHGLSVDELGNPETPMLDAVQSLEATLHGDIQGLRDDFREYRELREADRFERELRAG